MTEEEVESVWQDMRTAVAASTMKVRGQRSRNDWGRVEAGGPRYVGGGILKPELSKVRWAIISQLLKPLLPLFSLQPS